jgi:hypothetical protein
MHHVQLARRARRGGLAKTAHLRSQYDHWVPFAPKLNVTRRLQIVYIHPSHP